MKNFIPSTKFTGSIGVVDGMDFFLLNTDQIQADAEGTSLTDKLEAISSLGYDDTAIKTRISKLEDKPDKDTVYDDTDVKKRLSDLEAKTDKDTTYSAGTAISISATNEISVDRDALNIPDITENTNAIAGHTTDIANLQKAVAEQTDLIAKYEATLDWIINEYDPSIESEVGNG